MAEKDLMVKYNGWESFLKPNLPFLLRQWQNGEEKDLAAAITFIPSATVLIIPGTWNHFKCMQREGSLADDRFGRAGRFI